MSYVIHADTTEEARTEIVKVIRHLAAIEINRAKIYCLKRDIDRVQHMASAYNDAAEFVANLEIKPNEDEPK